MKHSKMGNMFTLLVNYKVRGDDCNTPMKHQEDGGSNLGSWLKTQRNGKKKGILNVEREDILATLGVVWRV